jgi:hypothetical protein
MKRLEEFAKKNKEESIFIKDIITNNDINKSSIIDYIFLIEINAKKYKIYKEFINKNKKRTTKISICKNNNIINVYIGPLYIKEIINNILRKIPKEDGKLIKITHKEFNNRCNF